MITIYAGMDPFFSLHSMTAVFFSPELLILQIYQSPTLYRTLVPSTDCLIYPFDFACENKTKEILKIHFLIPKFLFKKKISSWFVFKCYFVNAPRVVPLIALHCLYYVQITRYSCCVTFHLPTSSLSLSSADFQALCRKIKSLMVLKMLQ